MLYVGGRGENISPILGRGSYYWAIAVSDRGLSTPEVYAEMMQSADEGVAEFLDLAYVKPNTLGNTRMLAVL